MFKRNLGTFVIKKDSEEDKKAVINLIKDITSGKVDDFYVPKLKKKKEVK